MHKEIDLYLNCEHTTGNNSSVLQHECLYNSMFFFPRLISKVIAQ